MTFRRFRVVPFLAALASIALTLPAQGESGDEINRAKRILDQAVKKGQPGPDGDLTAEKLRNMTPEERLEHGKRRGARGLCTFVATCRPPKLLPGQTGTVLISAILQGKSVLPAPAQVIMLPQPASNPLLFGSLSAHPAEPGSLAKAYLGRPVYENTAEFEVPVTVPATAKLGEKLPISFNLQFDLYDGNTANPLGRFIESVTTEVEIGQYVDPPVEGRRTAPAAEPAAAQSTPVEAAPAKDAGSGDPVQPDADVLTGNAAAVADPVVPDSGDAAPVAEADSGAGSLPPATGEEGLPLSLLAGGGAILLVLVLLLMRRK